MAAAVEQKYAILQKGDVLAKFRQKFDRQLIAELVGFVEEKLNHHDKAKRLKEIWRQKIMQRMSCMVLCTRTYTMSLTLNWTVVLTSDTSF